MEGSVDHGKNQGLPIKVNHGRIRVNHGRIKVDNGKIKLDHGRMKKFALR
jgi:hypothetical protein